MTEFKSGKNLADILYIVPNFNFPGLADNNLLLPLDSYIDFKDAAFSNASQKAVLRNDKHYGICISYNRYGDIFLTYNKKIIQQEGLADPQELQKSGQWTWNNFLDITLKTTKDINTDGQTDLWGISDTLYYTFMVNMVLSNNADFTRDDNGSTLYALDDPDAGEAVQFVCDLYNVHKVVRNNTKFSPNTTTIYQNAESLFKTNKSAFITMYTTPNDTNAEYGLVLYPKGPKAHDYTTFDSGGNFYAIPSATQNPSQIAAVMKVLFSVFDATKEDYIKPDEVPASTPSQYAETMKLSQQSKKYSYLIPLNPFYSKYNIAFNEIITKNLNAADKLREISSPAQQALDELASEFK